MLQRLHATNIFTADGVRTDWAFQFDGVAPDNNSGTTPYLYGDDVLVQEIYRDANGAEVIVERQRELIAPNTVRVLGAPIAAGHTVKVFRSTQDRYPLVDYRDRQTVSEFDLDLAARQVLYVSMETKDIAELASDVADQSRILAEQAAGTADEAKALSQQAVSTSDQANSTANDALATSQIAETNSEEAVRLAGLADQKAEDVKALADASEQYAAAAATSAAEAASDAANAVSTANGVDNKAQTALDQSTTALGTADAASTIALGIDAKATQAMSTANLALGTADAASTIALGIDAKATQAMSTANLALGTADAASTIANSALVTANAVDGKAQSALDRATAAELAVVGTVRKVDNIAALRALPKTGNKAAMVGGYYARGDGGGGTYFLDVTDTTSVDNGGTVIVAADGGRWLLVHTGHLSISQFGASPGQSASVNRVAIQAAVDSFPLTGSLLIPPGVFDVDDSIVCDDKFVTFHGLGEAVSVIRYTPAAAGVLFDLRHTVANSRAFEFRDMTISTNVVSAGTAIKISAKLTGASVQINGEDDALLVGNVRISQEGSGYWTTFVHQIHTGGVHLNSVSFDNTLTAAQANASVTGILVENSDARVSTIRTLSVNDYYILRTAVGVNLIGNATRQIESIYFNTGEIVGVSEAAVKASGLVGALGFVNGHFDVNKYVLDARAGNLLISRFVGCDFRKGSTGVPVVNGTMFAFDAGEMVTFSGCMFSGSNHVSPSSTNTTFNFTNNMNGLALYRATVSGSVFRNFYYIFGDSLNCKLNSAGNTYNAITGAVLKDDRLDNSIAVRDAVVMKTLTASLDNTGTATINVPVPSKFFGQSWPVAMLQVASNTDTDVLNIRYDFESSTATTCVFIVRGNTTARTVRFSFMASGISDPIAT